MPYNPVWLKARKHHRKVIKPLLPGVGTVMAVRMERFPSLPPVAAPNKAVETVKIGDTLFVGGEPHGQCGNCGAVVKLGQRIDTTTEVSRPEANAVGRLHKPPKPALRDYKVQVLLGFREEVDYVWVGGEQQIERKFYPILRSVLACQACWEKQQQTGESFDHRGSK